MSRLRLLVVLPGLGLLAVATAYILLTQAIAIFTIPASVVTIIIGLKLPRPQKITVGQGSGGSSPLVVDRAVLGATIYQLFFFDTRLILKRLATSRTTVLALAILAVIGYFIGDHVIGLLAGVAAGYAIQEYIAQTGRIKTPVSNSGFKLADGDIELPYDDLEKVELDGNKLVLFSKRGITKLGMSRGYGAVIAPALMTLSRGKFRIEQSVHSSDALRKQHE